MQWHALTVCDCLCYVLFVVERLCTTKSMSWDFYVKKYVYICFSLLILWVLSEKRISTFTFTFIWVLICWWWRFDWSIARLQLSPPLPLSLVPIIPANPGSPGKWPLKRRVSISTFTCSNGGGYATEFVSSVCLCACMRMLLCVCEQEKVMDRFWRYFLLSWLPGQRRHEWLFGRMLNVFMRCRV